MMTVKDKLLANAGTESQRDFIELLMDDRRDQNCARQRAWQEVGNRLARDTYRISW